MPFAIAQAEVFQVLPISPCEFAASKKTGAKAVNRFQRAIFLKQSHGMFSSQTLEQGILEVLALSFQHMVHGFCAPGQSLRRKASCLGSSGGEKEKRGGKKPSRDTTPQGKDDKGLGQVPFESSPY